jgi:hypothetical protein
MDKPGLRGLDDIHECSSSGTLRMDGGARLERSKGVRKRRGRIVELLRGMCD